MAQEAAAASATRVTELQAKLSCSISLDLPPSPYVHASDHVSPSCRRSSMSSIPPPPSEILCRCERTSLDGWWTITIVRA